jgi:1-phosphatidylinositol-4-phosphate 5-kinase
MLDSLDIRRNREMIFKAGEGSGSSGSFFFFSKDNKFLIKTINKQEKDIFLSMIDSYIEHIRNNQSVLARIYGILTIKTQDFKGIHIIIMQNTSYIYS